MKKEFVRAGIHQQEKLNKISSVIVPAIQTNKITPVIATQKVFGMSAWTITFKKHNMSVSRGRKNHV